MFRHAIAPSRDYLKAPHAIVRHARLNNDAKMLLLYVLGLPDGRCDKPLSEHAARLGLKGRAYQRAKALLVECGFLRENKSQNERGRWVTEQVLTNGIDVPVGVAPVEPAIPSTRIPTVGDSTDRVVGDSPTQDEEQEKKNAPHPPSEDEPDGEPVTLTGELAEAERVLLSLRRIDRRLHLGVREARRLAALAVEWLRRGVSPGELRRALSSGLPKEEIASVVGFLRYRLVEKRPEVPSLARLLATAERPPGRERERERAALVLCAGPGDDHMFRPVEGETQCGECRREAAAAAAGVAGATSGVSGALVASGEGAALFGSVAGPGRASRALLRRVACGDSAPLHP